MRTRLRGRCSGDGGGAGALEYALIAPVFLALIFALVQGGLLWEAHHVINGIADGAGRDARSYQVYQQRYGLDTATLPSTGQVRAVATDSVAGLRHGGRNTIDPSELAPDVALQGVAAPSAQVVSVTVSGRAISLLGFTLPPITVTSTGPYEGFRPDPTVP